MTGESGARLKEVENRVIDIHRDIRGGIHGGAARAEREDGSPEESQ